MPVEELPLSLPGNFPKEPEEVLPEVIPVQPEAEALPVANFLQESSQAQKIIERRAQGQEITPEEEVLVLKNLIDQGNQSGYAAHLLDKMGFDGEEVTEKWKNALNTFGVKKAETLKEGEEVKPDGEVEDLLARVYQGEQPGLTDYDKENLRDVLIAGGLTLPVAATLATALPVSDALFLINSVALGASGGVVGGALSELPLYTRLGQKGRGSRGYRSVKQIMANVEAARKAALEVQKEGEASAENLRLVEKLADTLQQQELGKLDEAGLFLEKKKRAEKFRALGSVVGGGVGMVAAGLLSRFGPEGTQAYAGTFSLRSSLYGAALFNVVAAGYRKLFPKLKPVLVAPSELPSGDQPTEQPAIGAEELEDVQEKNGREEEGGLLREKQKEAEEEKERGLEGVRLSLEELSTPTDNFSEKSAGVDSRPSDETVVDVSDEIEQQLVDEGELPSEGTPPETPPPPEPPVASPGGEPSGEGDEKGTGEKKEEQAEKKTEKNQEGQNEQEAEKKKWYKKSEIPASMEGKVERIRKYLGSELEQKQLTNLLRQLDEDLALLSDEWSGKPSKDKNSARRIAASRRVRECATILGVDYPLQPPAQPNQTQSVTVWQQDIKLMLEEGPPGEFELPSEYFVEPGKEDSPFPSTLKDGLNKGWGALLSAAETVAGSIGSQERTVEEASSGWQPRKPDPAREAKKEELRKVFLQRILENNQRYLDQYTPQGTQVDSQAGQAVFAKAVQAENEAVEKLLGDDNAGDFIRKLRHGLDYYVTLFHLEASPELIARTERHLEQLYELADEYGLKPNSENKYAGNGIRGLIIEYKDVSREQFEKIQANLGFEVGEEVAVDIPAQYVSWGWKVKQNKQYAPTPQGSMEYLTVERNGVTKDVFMDSVIDPQTGMGLRTARIKTTVNIMDEGQPVREGGWKVQALNPTFTEKGQETEALVRSADGRERRVLVRELRLANPMTKTIDIPPTEEEMRKRREANTKRGVGSEFQVKDPTVTLRTTQKDMDDFEREMRLLNEGAVTTVQGILRNNSKDASRGIHREYPAGGQEEQKKPWASMLFLTEPPHHAEESPEMRAVAGIGKASRQKELALPAVEREAFWALRQMEELEGYVPGLARLWVAQVNHPEIKEIFSRTHLGRRIVGDPRIPTRVNPAEVPELSEEEVGQAVAWLTTVAGNFQLLNFYLADVGITPEGLGTEGALWPLWYPEEKKMKIARLLTGLREESNDMEDDKRKQAEAKERKSEEWMRSLERTNANPAQVAATRQRITTELDTIFQERKARADEKEKQNRKEPGSTSPAEVPYQFPGTIERLAMFTRATDSIDTISNQDRRVVLYEAVDRYLTAAADNQETLKTQWRQAIKNILVASPESIRRRVGEKLMGTP